MMSFSMMVAEILIGLICFPLVLSGQPQAVLFGLCAMAVSFALAYYEFKRFCGISQDHEIHSQITENAPSWATHVIIPVSANTTANASTLHDPNWDAENENKWF